MTVTNKRTSDKLERALSKYNLDALPVEVKSELGAAMKCPDFDPDKLAEALERAEAEKTSPVKSSHSERLTFLEIIQAVFKGIKYLLIAFLGYNFTICVGFSFIYAMLTIFDRLLDSTVGTTLLSDFFGFLLEWIQVHPTLSLTVAIVLYVAGFLYYTYKLAMYVADSLIQNIKTV